MRRRVGGGVLDAPASRHQRDVREAVPYGVIDQREEYPFLPPSIEVIGMKYLTQFLRITGFTLVGELLQRLVPLPIPASVYGLVLLFAALCFGVIKLEQVKDAGGFLISILPILFVSPAVGILENWGMIRSAVIPMFLLALLSTITTFAIAGRITQSLRKKEEDHDQAA